MLTSTLLPLLAAFISPLAASTIIQDSAKVDFDTYLKRHDRLLVSFTARTLPSLSSFDSIFASSATNISTPFISIDCDQETELCVEHDINSYPTIRLFEKSNEKELSMTRYRGPRTTTAIRSFVRKHELPVLSHISTSDVATFKTIDSIVLIAYLSPSQTSLLSAFNSVASRYHHTYVFGYTTDTSGADTEAVSVPSIVCYKNVDGDHRVLNGHFSEADVESFLGTATKSVIKTYKEKDMDIFMQRDKLTVYIFTTILDSASTSLLRRQLTPLAKKYEKYVIFAVADVGRYAEMAGNFGVETDSGGKGEKAVWPALVVHAPMNDNVFLYQRGKKIEAVLVERMLTTVLQGKATNGEVFGGEAERGVTEAEAEDVGHDEL